MPAEKVKIVWRPHPGSQTLFLSCPLREVLLEGTRGGGKTDVLLMDFAQHCGVGFGAAWRGILFRETYPQLADVVAKSRKWFPQVFQGAKFNESDYVWTWPTGEQLFLRHMKREADYWNYHGHEYPWIGWEELTNWATRVCYDSMFACNRSSSPDVPRKIRSTTNPYGKGHSWVKGDFIDPAPNGVVIVDEREIPMVEDGGLVRRKVEIKRVTLHSSYLENPSLMVADPMYLAALEKITDENKRRAWLFGDWNIVAGGMFSDLWTPSRHIVDPFPIPKEWRVDRSFDWGSSKPYSVGWWAESDGSDIILPSGKRFCTLPGDLFRVGELYGWNGTPNEGTKETAKEIAEKIKAREKEMGLKVHPGPADSAIWADENDNCIAKDMEEKEVKWLMANKSPGSRVNGWNLMRERLKASLERNGKGLFVFSSCRHFIRTIPVLPRDVDGGKPDDVDTDSEDHIADETRYRVLREAPAIGKKSFVPGVGG